MTSFISIFITVGICLAIYAYIKKKYAAQIALLEEQIANLNLDAIKYKAHIKELDEKVFIAGKEISIYKSKLDTMVDINKELNASKSQVKAANAPTVPTEVKKRGRKPGSKKPFYKKKSGGNPS